MDETWLRWLSLTLVPVGLGIAVLGFGVVGAMEGLLGVGIVVAGVALLSIIPGATESGERDDATNQTNRRLILLIGLLGAITVSGYLIASFL